MAFAVFFLEIKHHIADDAHDIQREAGHGAQEKVGKTGADRGGRLYQKKGALGVHLVGDAGDDGGKNA